MGRTSVVAKRLKEARKRRGLSQYELGVAAGIDEMSASQRVSQYERGVHVPDLETTQHLARALRAPAPFFYAQDNSLAAWILAYAKVSSHLRRDILRGTGEEG